jgi:hypothetical protein
MAAKKQASNNRNLVVEVPLPDGCLSMYVGEEVGRDGDSITLRKASWIACTGRRHLFFAGQADANAEIEPYPDDTEISLPLPGSILTSWAHELPRQVR